MYLNLHAEQKCTYVCTNTQVPRCVRQNSWKYAVRAIKGSNQIPCNYNSELRFSVTIHYNICSSVTYLTCNRWVAWFTLFLRKSHAGPQQLSTNFAKCHRIQASAVMIVPDDLHKTPHFWVRSLGTTNIQLLMHRICEWAFLI